MAGKISELTAATAYNSTDEVELLQSGGNLRLSKGVLRKLLYGTAADGNTPRYDSALANADTVSGGTGDWVLDDSSGYRAVNTGRYSTTPAGAGTQITMTNTDDFETKDYAGLPTGNIAKGLPVRFVIANTVYYGIVTTGVQNSSITIAGASLSGTFSALCVGPFEKVVQVVLPMVEVVDYSNTLSTTNLATFGLSYYKWRMSTAYLVSFSATHKTAAATTQPKVNVLIAGSRVSNNDSNLGLQLSTAGTWVDNSAIAINTSNYDINWDESLEVEVTAVGTGAAGDHLTVSCTFVLA